jgi:hypothetical protein
LIYLLKSSHVCPVTFTAEQSAMRPVIEHHEQAGRRDAIVERCQRLGGGAESGGEKTPLKRPASATALISPAFSNVLPTRPRLSFAGGISPMQNPSGIGHSCLLAPPVY